MPTGRPKVLRSVTPGALIERQDNMSNSTLVKAQADREAAEVAAIVADLGISEVDSKARQAALKAVRDAAKGKGRDVLVSALAEHVAPLYADTAKAESASRVFSAVAAQAKSLTDSMHALAFDIVRTARQVDPKVPASTIGYAVENGGQTLPKDDKRGQAIRQRWSRYANAVEAAETSRKAVDNGLGSERITPRAAFAAIASGAATPTAVKAAAAEGRPIPKATAPKGRVQATTGDVAEDPTTTGADLVNAASTFADVVKRLGPDEVKSLTPLQVAAISKSLAKVWGTLASIGVHPEG